MGESKIFIFQDVPYYFKISKFPGYWFPKMHQDSTNWSSELSWDSKPHQQLFKNIQQVSKSVFNIIADLIGFTWRSRSSKNILDFQDVIKISPCCVPFLFKPIVKANWFWPTTQIMFICLAPPFPAFPSLMIFKMLRSINILYANNVHMFLRLLRISWYIR